MLTIICLCARDSFAWMHASCLLVEKTRLIAASIVQQRPLLPPQRITTMECYENYVAEIVERGPAHENKHHLVPFGKIQPHFREVLHDSKMFATSPRLRMLFSNATWHIGEEDGAGELKKVFATLDVNRFPNKEDAWINSGEAQTTTFRCCLLTIDEYSANVLFVNFNQGATTNQLAKFREEYALAHAQCFNKIHMLESQTMCIHATTEELKTSVGDLQQTQLEILRDQGRVNKGIEERLDKLEKLEEQLLSGAPAKKQRLGTCQNRHHEQVKPHQWLNPGDVVLLKTHALEKHVVETWTGSRYLLCGKISGKHVQANNRSMLWPCPSCNVGKDDVAA